MIFYALFIKNVWNFRKKYNFTIANIMIELFLYFWRDWIIPLNTVTWPEIWKFSLWSIKLTYLMLNHAWFIFLLTRMLRFQDKNSLQLYNYIIARGKMFSTNQSICVRFRSQPIRLRKIALAKRKPANLYTNIGSSIMAEGVRFFRLLDWNQYNRIKHRFF